MPRIGMVAARVEHLARIRDYGLKRAEMVQLRCTQSEARRIIAAEWPHFSAHVPLVFPDWYPDWPLTAALVDFDPDRREATFRLIEETMALARDLGAGYTTVHAQRAVLLLGEPSAGATVQAAADLARSGCLRLQELASRYALPVHLENMIAHPCFYAADHYLEAVRDCPDVLLCLDVGHLIIDALRFGFDYMDFVRAVAPHVGSIHVYNNRFDGQFEFGEMRERGLLRKLPVHPSERPSEGWIDIEGTLRIVLAANPQCFINHEIYAMLDTDAGKTREGLAWVARIWREATARAAVQAPTEEPTS